MIRRTVCALLVAAAVCGVAAGEEFFAVIRKVEGGEVTFNRVREKEGRKLREMEETTLPLDEKVKVVKLNVTRSEDKKARWKYEPGGELPGGLANERVKKLLAKAKANAKTVLPARIITDDGGKKIKEVQVRLPRS